MYTRFTFIKYLVKGKQRELADSRRTCQAGSYKHRRLAGTIRFIYQPYYCDSQNNIQLLILLHERVMAMVLW